MNEDDILRQLDNSNDIQDELKNFKPSLGKSITSQIQDTHTSNIKSGYINLNLADFPTQGIFYRNDMKILIRAAQVKEIRAFSVIDETNLYEVDDALIDILSSCCKVSYSDKVGSWKDICEEDRSYLIFAIRELTFSEGENAITFQVKCDSCGADNKMEIKNENFQTRKINTDLLKYYDRSKSLFIIKTKSYGEIILSSPSIGVMRIINTYIKKLKTDKKDVKAYIPFLKILPFLAKDWRSFNDDSINDFQIKFLSWDSKKFSLYNELIEKIQLGIKDKLIKQCDKCGENIEAELQLPNGIKGLFIENNILDSELL